MDENRQVQQGRATTTIIVAAVLLLLLSALFVFSQRPTAPTRDTSVETDITVEEPQNTTVTEMMMTPAPTDVRQTSSPSPSPMVTGMMSVTGTVSVTAGATPMR